MKSIGTNHSVHGEQGDERIRTAVPVAATESSYELDYDLVLVSLLDWCIGYASMGQPEKWADRLVEKLTEARDRARGVSA